MLPLLYSFLFIFLILKMKFFDVPAISRGQLIALFILKISAGLAVYGVYTYYYTNSDFNTYFSSGKIVFDRFLGNAALPVLPAWDASFDDAVYNNSRIIIFLNFLIHFFSFNTIFVHIVFFCFFAFAGLVALFKAFYKHVPSKKNSLIVGLFLVPSVLFWTAGIYKETIALCCIGFIVYLTDFGLMKKITLKNFLLIALLCLLLFFLKIYILAALLPMLIINWLISNSSASYCFLKYFLLFLLFSGLFHLLSKTSDRFDVYQLIADKQSKAISEAKGGIFLMNDKNFVRIDYSDVDVLIHHPDSSYTIKKGSRFLSWKLNNMQDTTFVSASSDSAFYTLLYIISPTKSVIDIDRVDPTFFGILKKVPQSIYAVFTQPILFNIKNIFQLIAWIENSWLFLLLVLAILFFDKNILNKKHVLMFALLFALIQFAIIGLTTPAIGAMVRYKVTAFPFLVTSFLICIDGDALVKKIIRTKNQDSDKA